jgi:hypothetical protein
MVVIDWDDPALQAILTCREGGRAWKLLGEYLEPVRDTIWSKRREGLPKRGGRRSASQREADEKLLAEALEESRRMREEVEWEEEMLRQVAKTRKHH